ncbi:MAG: acyltransferase [Actinobacteria bacterium]|nr:acyltransferase [Actinomycetota bacterium]
MSEPRWLDRLPPKLRELAEEPLARVALRAKVMEPYWRMRFAEFGQGSILHRPDWIYGPQRIAIGSGVMIMHRAWLSAERPTWERPDPALRIGDGCAIRVNVTISAAESIVLEDNVGIGAHSSVLDNDHSWGESEHVLHNPFVTTPIHIGEGTWVAERCAILRGARIGKFCIIGANSVVRAGEIPDYSIAVGAPARIVGTTKQGKGVRAAPD